MHMHTVASPNGRRDIDCIKDDLKSMLFVVQSSQSIKMYELKSRRRRTMPSQAHSSVLASLHRVMRSPAGMRARFEFGFSRGCERGRLFDVMLQMIEQVLMMSEQEQRHVSLSGCLDPLLVRSVLKTIGLLNRGLITRTCPSWKSGKVDKKTRRKKEESSEQETLPLLAVVAVAAIEAALERCARHVLGSERPAASAIAPARVTRLLPRLLRPAPAASPCDRWCGAKCCCYRQWRPRKKRTMRPSPRPAAELHERKERGGSDPDATTNESVENRGRRKRRQQKEKKRRQQRWNQTTKTHCWRPLWQFELAPPPWRVVELVARPLAPERTRPSPPVVLAASHCEPPEHARTGSAHNRPSKRLCEGNIHKQAAQREASAAAR